MARTATKKQENILESTPIPEVDNYPLVITLAATDSPDQLPGGAMTQEQARMYIQALQHQGFKILSSDVIQAGDVNGIFTLQVFYCLVKGQ
jgi:hypothetical protein